MAAWGNPDMRVLLAWLIVLGAFAGSATAFGIWGSRKVAAHVQIETSCMLLDAAEKEGFGVLVTTDANLKHQQNLASRQIAIVLLTTPSWPRIQRAVGPILRAIERATPGSCTEVQVP